MQTPKNQGLFGKGLKSLLSMASQNVELYSAELTPSNQVLNVCILVQIFICRKSKIQKAVCPLLFGTLKASFKPFMTQSSLLMTLIKKPF